MKVFIAGVMQGNLKELGVVSQTYRMDLLMILKKHIRGVEVIDPDVTDPDRLKYDNVEAGGMFFKYCDIAKEVDLLISYVPQASMGTAIEMWQAFNSGVPIITISDMKHNWVIRLLSSEIYPDIATFEKNIQQSEIMKKFG